MLRKNDLFLAWLLGISANSKENHRCLTSRLLLIFREILNLQKIYNTTSSNIGKVWWEILNICVANFMCFPAVNKF